MGQTAKYKQASSEVPYGPCITSLIPSKVGSCRRAVDLPPEASLATVREGPACRTRGTKPSLPSRRVGAFQFVIVCPLNPAPSSFNTQHQASSSASCVSLWLDSHNITHF